MNNTHGHWLMLWWSPTQQIGHVAIATAQQKLTELIGGVRVKIEVLFVEIPS